MELKGLTAVLRDQAIAKSMGFEVWNVVVPNLQYQ